MRFFVSPKGDRQADYLISHCLSGWAEVPSSYSVLSVPRHYQQRTLTSHWSDYFSKSGLLLWRRLWKFASYFLSYHLPPFLVGTSDCKWNWRDKKRMKKECRQKIFGMKNRDSCKSKNPGKNTADSMQIKMWYSCAIQRTSLVIGEMYIWNFENLKVNTRKFYLYLKKLECSIIILY